MGFLDQLTRAIEVGQGARQPMDTMQPTGTQ